MATKLRKRTFIGRDKLRGKCLYSEFFWSVLSCVRTEYGEILRISPYSVLQSECGKIWTKKRPNTGSFHAVTHWLLKQCY